MAGPLSSAIQFDVDILGTSRDVANEAAGTNTNSITAQAGDVVSQQATEQNVAWRQHVGLCSRPSNAVAGKAAAQGVLLSGSSQSYCIASSDVRGQALYANLQAGETCLYAGGADGNGTAVVTVKANGDAVMANKFGNTASGQTQFVMLGADGSFRVETACGRIVMDATGIHLIHASGARLDMGGIGGLPAPLNQVSSYCRLSAAVVHCNGGIATQLGPVPALSAGGTPLFGPTLTTSIGSPSLIVGSGNVFISP